MAEVVVEKMKRTRLVKTYPRAQERTPGGGMLHCELTASLVLKSCLGEERIRSTYRAICIALEIVLHHGIVALPPASNRSHLRSKPESRKPESRWEQGTDGTNDGKVRTIASSFIGRSDPPHRKKGGPMSRQEYLRARFYRHYQREAEEYDREFTKKYDDDLNTTLIFVSLARNLDTRER